MGTIAGLTAVAIIVIGTVFVARTPGAMTPRTPAVVMMENQSDEAPAYTNVDPDDWR